MILPKKGLWCVRPSYRPVERINQRDRLPEKGMALYFPYNETFAQILWLFALSIIQKPIYSKITC